MEMRSNFFKPTSILSGKSIAEPKNTAKILPKEIKAKDEFWALMGGGISAAQNGQRTLGIG